MYSLPPGLLYVRHIEDCKKEKDLSSRSLLSRYPNEKPKHKHSNNKDVFRRIKS